MSNNFDQKRVENQLSDSIPDLKVIRGAIFTLSEALDGYPPDDYFGCTGQIDIIRVSLTEIFRVVNLVIDDLTALMPEK